MNKLGESPSSLESNREFTSIDPVASGIIGSTRGNLAKLAFLSFLLAGFGCGENSPANSCGTFSVQDISVDIGKLGSDTSTDSKDSTVDASKPSFGIPATTLPILKHAMDCDTAYRNADHWCDSNILSRIPSDPKFCDYTSAEDPSSIPKRIKDACEKKTEECKTTGYLINKFLDCLATIPADPACKAKLNPTSNASDADGDGLSDHFELWESHTNPCEPCSYGNSVPCDAEADSDNDGVSNKDASTYFYGGCSTIYVPTDECG